MFLIAALSAAGIWSYQRLPIDAVPDITNVQVQINTAAAGYSPLEVEQRITYLVETAIAGLPHIEYTRSLSRYGLSQVTRSEEHTSELQSLMRISYAVFCLKQKTTAKSY